MSSISTSVGLISGLPISSLVDQLIAIQSRPVTLMQNRIAELTQKKTAFLGISAQLLSLRSTAVRFGDASFFRAARASSSNESTLLATASSGAAVGQYTFTVRNLASSHQLISAGFATADGSPVGGGTLTIEGAAGRLDRSTSLSLLNGGDGVRSGRIRVTDRAGHVADIDLTGATTVQDVLRAINSPTTAAVTARIDGDRLVIEDHSGSTGLLSVADIDSGHAGEDLGILGVVSADSLNGTDRVRLSSSFRLDHLNDGNGIRRLSAQSDFRITTGDGASFDVSLAERLSDSTPLSILNSGGGVPAGRIRATNRAGISAEIDLTGAQTIGDVKAAIAAAGIGLSVSTVGAKLVVTDSTAGAGATKFEEVAGGTTAASLGINKSSTTGAITGNAIYRVQAIGDVLRVINTSTGNNGAAVASLTSDGKGLTLTDTTGGGGGLVVESLNGSGAAEDLGLLGSSHGPSLSSRRLVAGLDTVLLRSLNGGGGVETGVIQITNRAGQTATVDVSAAQSLSDVLSAINGQTGTTGISARVSGSGLGIELSDASGGTGSLIVADVTGHTAEALHISGSAAGTTVRSGNLQKQYISAATRLADLNGGRGVPSGRFRITDSTGASALVDLSQGDEVTLQNVLDEINSRPIGVHASINATGDGLLLTDTAGGAARLKVSEDGGSTASALGLVGEAADGQTTIDGSFETRLNIGAGETLNDVLARLRASRAPIQASIINDGSAARPYRLNLASTQSGLAGELAIDAGDTSLGFDTLVRARDATLVFGSGEQASPIVLTSSSNTISNVINGVTLNLVSAGANPVTVTVTRNLDSIVTDLSNFVSSYNSALSNIATLTKFDSETETRGVLQGDSTISRVRGRLIDLVSRTVPGQSPPYNRLSSIGISVGSGSTLQFDETKFRAAYAANPAAVEALLSADETGFASRLKTEIDQLTDPEKGTIPTATHALNDFQDVLNDRITQLNALLNKRRDRLLAQFNATEEILSKMQQQQSALSALAGSISSLTTK